MSKINQGKNMSFVAGTLVHTDKGLVPIQDIKVNDMVLSKSETGEGELVYSRVIRTMKSADKKPIMTPVQGIYCTQEHPFWTHIHRVGKPRWLAARHINWSDHVECLYPFIDGIGHPCKIRGRYEERVFGKDPYGVGGAYLIATSDPNVALYMIDSDGDEGGPNYIPMGVVDFSSGEPVEIYSNDKKHYIGWDGFLSKAPDKPWAAYKFLDKDNPEHHADIVRYSKLWDDYLTPDWDTDINATSTAFTDYVYNIEVEDTHTYFVGYNGVWVHE
ncbi:hypothetical protein [Psychrobacter sp. I-STPA10]|uniref:hypothetical protein n=1 Tax=Psychrobacter sp. I-STPA10 TaxID=2585769 RepID=UPI001E65A32E|nr:hypothetical protein [Psychrobacter sp. I-STPA10]